MSRLGQKILIATGLVILAGATVSFVLHRQFDNDPSVQRFRATKGKNEAEVRSALGPPQRIYDKASAPAEYYEKGYTFERRPISNRVFVYFGNPDLIAYIYFDSSNRVEHVFVGSS